MTEHTLLRLWGKTDKFDASRYHPLLFHLLDVGFVARDMWRVLSPHIRAGLAASLGLTETDAEQVVVLLAAQHDLGKASAFQTKAPCLFDQVAAVGLTFAEQAPPQEPHGYVTAATLPLFAEQGEGGWQASRPSARRLARIVGGHHGTFPTASDLLEDRMTPRTLGGEAWSEARRALLQALAETLYPDAPSVALSTPTLDDPTLAPLLGGFVSVADWIGSSQAHFPPAGPISLKDYAPRARRQAQQALDAFGWTRRPRFSAPAAFGDLFQDKEGRPFTPNPMQTEVVRVADAATEPYLLIVEEAMGQGKTEAALYALDRALTTQQAHGFYIAMPTQATGNAMFERILHDYLREPRAGDERPRPRRHGGRQNLQLVHSGSFLSTAFDALQLAANDSGPGGEAERVVAESWFTARKQALLAPFGIGTIDQSLLSVLQARHWFVRLFGLAGKVVVFDEVHAYDVYMSKILGRLLGWLRALGCTVVLLSATLPRSRRRELCAAWAADAAPQEEPYPRVTVVNAGAAQTLPVTSQADEKAVRLERAGVGFQPLAERLRGDLPEGGCAAVICNTVGRAQEAYDLFRAELAKDGWEVLLFHARTPALWRQERERDVLDRYGKQGERPRRSVLSRNRVSTWTSTGWRRRWPPSTCCSSA